MTIRKKAWSASVGDYGNRIRCFEDPASGFIYAETRDPESGRYISRSLRHKDKDAAVVWAAQTVLKTKAGLAEFRDRTPTAARIFALYLKYRTVEKVPSEQVADERRVRCWTRTLGPTKDLSKLSLREWEGFVAARRSGAIDAEGEPVPVDKRKPVRDGTIWADCVFHLSVLNWATRWREEDRYLMSENPARGFPLPREKNVNRPVVSPERFSAIRAKADQVMMRVGRGEDFREMASYLPELLDIAWGTGRRVSAILSLRYADLRLADGPSGSICWPSDTDKMKKEWSAPINPQVRAAINRIRVDRQLKGSAFLFPNPNDPAKPLSKELASAWLRRAEELAEIQHLDGGGWHPFRRGWATSRKHLPDVDVAAAGGWSDLTSLKTCYQQADQETMLAVVAEPTQRRAAP
jgi:integrase